jgi:hypothetical protein
VGTLHDHLINFKVDFDIVNEKNSLIEKTTHVREIAHPWLDEDWGLTTRQQYIKSRYIDTEDESRLFYPPNFQGSFAVVNKDETNSWGVPRGYAIHPGYSPIYNVRLWNDPFLCFDFGRYARINAANRFFFFGFMLYPAVDCRWIETYAEQRQFCEAQSGCYKGKLSLLGVLCFANRT